MRLGFLHAAEVHVATFDRLVGEAVGTAVETVHRVRPDLLDVARRAGPAAVADDVRAVLDDLHGAGAEVVVCTCSTLGPVAEAVAGRAPAVLRVDRPGAALAVRRGGRAGLVVALASTLEPSSALLREEATRAGTSVVVVPVVVEGAWAAFEGGDQASYDALVAAAARGLADDVDVVLLAQASMLGALDLLGDLGERVVGTPTSAVAEAVRLLR